MLRCLPCGRALWAVFARGESNEASSHTSNCARSYTCTEMSSAFMRTHKPSDPATHFFRPTHRRQSPTLSSTPVGPARPRYPPPPTRGTKAHVPVHATRAPVGACEGETPSPQRVPTSSESRKTSTRCSICSMRGVQPAEDTGRRRKGNMASAFGRRGSLSDLPPRCQTGQRMRCPYGKSDAHRGGFPG